MELLQLMMVKESDSAQMGLNSFILSFNPEPEKGLEILRARETGGGGGFA